MNKTLQRGLATFGASGVLAAGLILGGAGSASASTGDWGYSSAGGTILAPGATLSTGGLSGTGVALVCLSSNGCQYDSTLTITGQALNGTTLSPTGVTQPLMSTGTGGPAVAVGTCTITSSTQVVCTPTATGSVSTNQGLFMDGSPFTFNVPSNLPNGTAVYELGWQDTIGMSGNYDGNDANGYTVISAAGAPIVDPAVGMGAAAAASIGAGGLAVARRRASQR